MFEPLTQPDYDFDERREEAELQHGERFQSWFPKEVLNDICMRLAEQSAKRERKPKLTGIDEAILRDKGEL